MIKRFFTKKSVAFLTVAILMAIVLPFHSAHAESFFTSWIGKAIGTVTEFSANSVVGIVKALIEYVMIPIASIWIAIAGTILDYSIQFTIYGDGITMLKTSMNSVWTLLRDVFNISFIFLLLYAAISQIITGSFKKAMVTSIIISAVLINFSFFFTRILVDASNIVATAIYNQIDAEQSQKTENFIQKTLKGFTSVLTGEPSKIDLSGRIMDGLNLTSILNETVTNMGTTADAPSFITKAGITWTYLGNEKWQSDKNVTFSTTEVMQTFTGDDASTKIAELTKQANEYDLKHPSSANTSSKTNASDSSNNDPKSIVGIGGLINSFTRWVLFFITAIIFTFFAVIFIGRFVSIIILMVTSPIGFVGGAIPGMSGFAKSWKDNLTNQLLIAPVIMFFMLLTIRLSTILRNGLPANPSPVVVFFNFFLVAFLLFKSVSITKKMSGAVGGFADKIGGLVSGLALGAATGGTALVGRQIVGRAASTLSNSTTGHKIRDLEAKGGIIGGAMGLLDKGIKGTAKSTFDVRGTKSFGTIVKQAQGMSDSSLIDGDYLKSGGIYGKGKNKKTGFEGWLENDKEKVTKRAKEIDEEKQKYLKKFEDEVTYQKGKVETIENQIKIETDPNKKQNLQNQLIGVKKDLQKAERNVADTEIERRKKNDPDFQKSDTLIQQFKNDKEDIDNKNKKLSDNIKFQKDALAGGAQSQSEYDKNMADLIHEQAILENKNRDLDINIEKEKIKQEQIEVKIKKQILTSNKKEDAIIRTQLEIKDRKQNFANSLRNGNSITNFLFNRRPLHTQSERESLARNAEKVNFTEKSKEEKANAALIEEISKLSDKKD